MAIVNIPSRKAVETAPQTVSASPQAFAATGNALAGLGQSISGAGQQMQSFAFNKQKAINEGHIASAKTDMALLDQDIQEGIEGQPPEKWDAITQGILNGKREEIIKSSFAPVVVDSLNAQWEHFSEVSSAKVRTQATKQQLRDSENAKKKFLDISIESKNLNEANGIIAQMELSEDEKEAWSAEAEMKIKRNISVEERTRALLMVETSGSLDELIAIREDPRVFTDNPNLTDHHVLEIQRNSNAAIKRVEFSQARRFREMNQKMTNGLAVFGKEEITEMGRRNEVDGLNPILAEKFIKLQDQYLNEEFAKEVKAKQTKAKSEKAKAKAQERFELGEITRRHKEVFARDKRKGGIWKKITHKIMLKETGLGVTGEKSNIQMETYKELLDSIDNSSQGVLAKKDLYDKVINAMQTDFVSDPDNEQQSGFMRNERELPKQEVKFFDSYASDLRKHFSETMEVSELDSFGETYYENVEKIGEFFASSEPKSQDDIAEFKAKLLQSHFDDLAVGKILGESALNLETQDQIERALSTGMITLERAEELIIEKGFE